MDIILEQNNGYKRYALEKSTNNTFYIVKKNVQFNHESKVSDITNINNTELNSDSEDSLANVKHSESVLPNFWIILKLQTDQKGNNFKNNNKVITVLFNVYFHCR